MLVNQYRKEQHGITQKTSALTPEQIRTQELEKEVE